MTFKLSKPPLNIEVTDFGWLKWFNDVYNIAKSFAVDIISGAVTIASNLTVGTAPDLFVDTANHVVGVGTGTPTAGNKLDIVDSSGSGTEIQVNIRSSSDSPFGLVIGKNKATAVADNIF